MHISAYFWMLNTHIAPFLTAGALASLSPRLANGGAGDQSHMGTRGLFSEGYFCNLRTRSRCQYLVRKGSDLSPIRDALSTPSPPVLNCRRYSDARGHSVDVGRKELLLMISEETALAPGTRALPDVAAKTSRCRKPSRGSVGRSSPRNS
jgi:hypothetical protein